MELWRYGRPIKQLGGRYTLIRPLGSGGMADVCLARDEQNKREVAAKVMIPDVADPGRPQRFLQEGKTALSLHHQHIIAVYDFGDHVKTENRDIKGYARSTELKIPYIVMEHVKGGSLKEWFQKKWLERRRTSPLDETLCIFEQLCVAVQYVHDKGMIHRDIKPANILFRELPQEGGPFEVVLSDFGLAVADNDTLSHPQAGSLLYMAPEQQQGHPQKASDIFSLGVVLYQLCTGHLPFQMGDLALPPQQPTQPNWLNPSLRPALNDAILRALSNDPSQRFASASLFWQSVQSAVKRTPSSQSNPANKVDNTPSNTEANTVDEHDDEEKMGTPDAGSAAATVSGAGLPAADDVLHTPSTSQGTGPDPNIESDDDWEALPPSPGQSIPPQLPNTPAAKGTDIASRKTPDTSSRTPTPIVLGTGSPTPLRTGKTTKILPPSATVSTAEPPPAPMTPASPTPNRNTGKGATAGARGATAGAVVGEALTDNATDKTAMASASSTTNTSKTPARNAGAGNTLRPAGSTSATSAGWPPPSPGRTKRPRGARPANRKRRAILIAALLAILTLLVLGGLTVSANPGMLSFAAPPPPATVTITPASKTVQDTYVLLSVNGNSNIANRQVGMRQLTSTKTDTKQVALTPFYRDPTSAKGSITFFNNAFSAQSVLSGTTFQVGNIQITTDQAANIPPAVLQPSFQRGQKTVPAHAVQTGAAGNIATSAINQPCCGSQEISAQNQNAFSGGADATVDYNYLKLDDANGVTNADQDPLKNSAQNDVKRQKKANEQFLGDIPCDNPKTTSDIPINEHKPTNVTTANVTVSVTCNAQVYDAKAIQTIAQNLLKQKVSRDPALAGYVLTGNIVTQVQPQDGPVTFSVLAKGVWAYQWTDTNKQKLLDKVKGKSIKDAQTILNSYAGVGSAKIDIGNGGTVLPSDVNQIRLVVNTVKGL
jgi:serine/threonine protein kinase